MKAGWAALLICLAAAPASAQCLQFRQIQRFTTVKGNDRVVIATDSFGKRFRLAVRQDCTGFDFDLGAGIRSMGSRRQACVAPGDEFVHPNPAAPHDRCTIASVEPYTAALEAADKAGRR